MATSLESSDEQDVKKAVMTAIERERENCNCAKPLLTINHLIGTYIGKSIKKSNEDEKKKKIKVKSIERMYWKAANFR